MKKSDIKDFMIVETGFDNKKYLVIKRKLIDDNLEGFSLAALESDPPPS